MNQELALIKNKFEERFIPEPNSGCYLWTGRNDGRNRYGRTELLGGKTKSAHKVSYLLYKGTVPEGMCIRHTCDNPICVNPAHLILGTLKENTYDMIKRGRAKLFSKRSENV